MSASRTSLFATHRRTILALVFGLAFSATLAYAVPPLTKYSAGATLDPNCAPGDTNCSVDISGSSPITVQNSSSLFSTGLSGTGDGSTATRSIFLGIDAGFGAVDVSNSNFFGMSAGYNAESAESSNFFGTQAGYNGTNASRSNFIGSAAGYQATNASQSNFFGFNAGYAATNASDSNFLGTNAGYQATNAIQSNFFGNGAGYTATNASYSNFFGLGSGFNASGAYNSNFFGSNAGYGATNALSSNFFGYTTGSGATNASNSIFIGHESGLNDMVDNTAAYDESSTFANTSILIGHRTSTGGFSNSIAIGAYAINTSENQFVAGSTTRPISSIFIGGGQGMASTTGTIFLGENAGKDAVNASRSVFLGLNAGQDAANAVNSNFFGTNAGREAGNAFDSIFFGFSAGYQAFDAYQSNFFGYNAGGGGAQNANDSNFFGFSAGAGAQNANNSNFFGYQAGNTSTNSANSFFAGRNAGGRNNNLNLGSVNAANSIFIGRNAGYFAADSGLDNTGSADDYSILLGQNTSTGGFENSIAIGSGATNTAANQFMIGSTTRPIDTTRINGSASTQCTITTGTGIACTSDERLKTDIQDLPTSTLDTLLNVRTITYTWKDNPSAPQQIGFLAQDLEQYFPQLVSTDSLGYKSVYYAQMTPILVEAIREINTTITSISDLTTDNSWRTALIEWFGNVGNGITQLFVGRIQTGELCVDDICVSREQFKRMVEQSGVAPTPTPIPEQDTSSDIEEPQDETSAPSDTSIEPPVEESVTPEETVQSVPEDTTQTP